MFEEYAVVKLKHDLPEHGIKAGTGGVIVMVHHAPDPAYEVELIDEEGDTWDVLTLEDKDLIPASADDFPPNEAAQSAF